MTTLPFRTSPIFCYILVSLSSSPNIIFTILPSSVHLRHPITDHLLHPSPIKPATALQYFPQKTEHVPQSVLPSHDPSQLTLMSAPLQTKHSYYLHRLGHHGSATTNRSIPSTCISCVEVDLGKIESKLKKLPRYFLSLFKGRLN